MTQKRIQKPSPNVGGSRDAGLRIYFSECSNALGRERPSAGDGSRRNGVVDRPVYHEYRRAAMVGSGVCVDADPDQSRYSIFDSG